MSLIGHLQPAGAQSGAGSSVHRATDRSVGQRRRHRISRRWPSAASDCDGSQGLTLGCTVGEWRGPAGRPYRREVAMRRMVLPCYSPWSARPSSAPAARARRSGPTGSVTLTHFASGDHMWFSLAHQGEKTPPGGRETCASSRQSCGRPRRVRRRLGRRRGAATAPARRPRPGPQRLSDAELLASRTASPTSGAGAETSIATRSARSPLTPWSSSSARSSTSPVT